MADKNNSDKERASDEKQVEKLFKDITNGILRRKRGADYDLSDSDDDLEARRRRKQREFAKMRKALLEDEKLGKIG
jgi:mediator of replication checkpoint protein 1